MDRKHPQIPNSFKQEELTINPETLLKKDKEGNLLSEASIDKLKSPWIEPVEELKDKCLEYFGSSVVSIYLSGSIASGTARTDSDIDMFLVLNREPLSEENEILKSTVGGSLKDKYPFVKKVDIMAIPATDLVANQGSFKRQFVAKLLSVPIYGKDLSTELPNFKADRETAIGLVENVSKSILKVKTGLTETEDAQKIEFMCKWIMKKFLRNSFYLVMAKDSIFTTSLETSYKLFVKAFPSKKEDIKHVFEMYTSPTSDKSKVEKVIATFGEWLSEELKKIKEVAQ